MAKDIDKSLRIGALIGKDSLMDFFASDCISGFRWEFSLRDIGHKT